MKSQTKAHPLPKTLESPSQKRINNEVYDFIPLTQADLDNGLSKEQIDALKKAFDINQVIKTFYELGCERAAEQEKERGK